LFFNATITFFFFFLIQFYSSLSLSDRIRLNKTPFCSR